MRIDELQKPKIALTIYEKDGSKYQIHPSVRKMRKMLKTSLESKFKNGATMKLRVVYGKVKTNKEKIEIMDNQADQSDIKNTDDLRLIFEAFIDKNLWLPIYKEGGEYSWKKTAQ